MIDHVLIYASNIEKSRNFYDETLTQLGYKRVMTFENGNILGYGTDNGAPGPRPLYHPGYYGASIIDLDGWRIEACFHAYKGNE